MCRGMGNVSRHVYMHMHVHTCTHICVTVLGYPPLPTWLLSDGRQALLDTDVMTFHNWLSVLQMVAPGAAI